MLTYDERGRLTSSTQGERSWGFSYDEQGNIDQITDPAERINAMEYDSVQRMLRRVLPGDRTLELDYDEHSNMTSVTPPGRAASCSFWTTPAWLPSPRTSGTHRPPLPVTAAA